MLFLQTSYRQLLTSNGALPLNNDQKSGAYYGLAACLANAADCLWTGSQSESESDLNEAQKMAQSMFQEAINAYQQVDKISVNRKSQTCFLNFILYGICRASLCNKMRKVSGPILQFEPRVCFSFFWIRCSRSVISNRVKSASCIYICPLINCETNLKDNFANRPAMTTHLEHSKFEFRMLYEFISGMSEFKII